MTGFNDRMRASAKKRGSRLVLALDFSDPFSQRIAHAQRVLDATKENVAAVKMNQHLLLPFGLEGVRGIIETSKKAGLPLIADLKMNDIESTNLNMVDSLLAYGFDAVIANPFVGADEGLGEVVKRMHSHGGGIILLVYMSHRGAGEGYGIRTESGEPLYRVFAKRARDWKADGVVVSAKSEDRIEETRAIVGKERLIFTPGIGAQGGSPPAGADFLIVGRSVTEATDPLAAVRRMARSDVIGGAVGALD